MNTKKKIIFIHNNKLLRDFMVDFFNNKGFSVKATNKGTEAFHLIENYQPDLLILDKLTKGINLSHFFMKKSLVPELSKVPMFLIGELVSNEINLLRNQNILGYMPDPVNITELVEKIYLYFNLNPVFVQNRTPMMIDLNRKDDIIIIQIEANLEPDKLDILGYEIRYLCKVNQIKQPKFLIIIPSLYPESITHANLDRLFSFFNYKELKLTPNRLKILTQCSPLINLLENIPSYRSFEIVKDFIDGIKKLNLDHQNKKIILTHKLISDTTYIFDLYDMNGVIKIPALTRITEDMINRFIQNGLKRLVYYSTTKLQGINKKYARYDLVDQETSDKIISHYTVADEEIFLTRKFDDKMELFFRKLKNTDVLVISYNKTDYDAIAQALPPYITINFVDNEKKLNDYENRKFIIIFLDINFSNQNTFEFINKIKSEHDQKTIPVVVTAKCISKETYADLKDKGFDNILYSPFSSTNVLQKIFESVTV